jgi:hypothetical protein
MSQKNIEKQMDEYLVKKAPFQIPENGRKTLVNWLPYLALIFGVLSALAAIALWNAGHSVNEAVKTANEISAAYGIEARTSELGLVYYISLFAILAEAALLLVAYPGLRERSKSKGWNLLLYGVGASLAYGLLVAFTVHGSLADSIMSLVGATVSLYILAQIKSHYSDKKSEAKQ